MLRKSGAQPLGHYQDQGGPPISQRVEKGINTQTVSRGSGGLILSGGAEIAPANRNAAGRTRG